MIFQPKTMWKRYMCTVCLVNIVNFIMAIIVQTVMDKPGVYSIIRNGYNYWYMYIIHVALRNLVQKI